MSGKTKTKTKKAPKKTTREKLLEWNEYYSRKQFGIGIECTKCKKWRLVYEYVEDYEVPKEWECNMSVIDGQKGHCGIPSSYKSNYFVNDDYVPGSIVWAKSPGYPWWPSMVEDDPDIEEFKNTEDVKEDEYHVVYFGEKIRRGWVPLSSLTPLVKRPINNARFIKKNKHRIEKELIVAEKMAEEALQMSIAGRLKNYSYAVLKPDIKYPISTIDTKMPKDSKKKRLRELPIASNERQENEIPTTSNERQVNGENELPITSNEKQENDSDTAILPLKKRKTRDTNDPSSSTSQDPTAPENPPQSPTASEDSSTYSASTDTTPYADIPQVSTATEDLFKFPAPDEGSMSCPSPTGTSLQPNVSVALGTGLQPNVSVDLDTDLQPNISVASGTNLQPNGSVDSDTDTGDLNTDLQSNVLVASGTGLQPNISIASGTDLQPNVSVALGTGLQPNGSVDSDTDSVDLNTDLQPNVLVASDTHRNETSPNTEDEPSSIYKLDFICKFSSDESTPPNSDMEDVGDKDVDEILAEFGYMDDEKISPAEVGNIPAYYSMLETETPLNCDKVGNWIPTEIKPFIRVENWDINNPNYPILQFPNT